MALQIFEAASESTLHPLTLRLWSTSLIRTLQSTRDNDELVKLRLGPLPVYVVRTLMLEMMIQAQCRDRSFKK